MIKSILRLLLLVLASGSGVFAALGNEFNDTLREVFQLPDTAEVVWPPHTNLGAGSILDPAHRVVAVATGSANRIPLSRSPAAVVLPAERLQPLIGFWIWRSFLANPEQLTVTLKLFEPEVVIWAPSDVSEQPFVRKANAEKLEASAAMGKIRRSWAARAALEITPRSEMPQANWLAMRKAALGDQTGTVRLGATSSSIVLTAPEKLTIAIDPKPGAVGQNQIPREGNISGPRRWALATIASGRYQFLAGMDQDWNAQSADLVADALADWHPTAFRSLKPAHSSGLSRQGVLAFLDTFVQAARKAKAELLVVYYVGHMERTGTGALSLLMGDAPADRKIRAPAPSTGVGNLRDIMQIVDQAEAELAPRQGSLDVAVIHRQLGRANIPFVLLVDGCLEDPNFADARQRLGIIVDAHGGEPRYVGPGDAGTALREQIAKLQAYPQDFPWLKSRDPTILGATPGTAAYSEPNPVWLLGGPVGPVARRLFDVVARTRWNSDRPNLIRILDFSADRQSIGPQELVGTVSWSDWLPHLRKFDPASFKN
jgi:hypothetical protein